MEIKVRLKWTSNVKVTVRDLAGKIIDVQEFHNLITTVGLGMIIDGMDGDISDFETKYLGIGDDNTTPALADTTLGNETFRKATTSTSQPAANQLLYITYLAPSEAVGTIEELAWFSGAGAGAGANTGIMISRVLYSHTKTAVESISVERTDQISEG